MLKAKHGDYGDNLAVAAERLATDSGIDSVDSIRLPDSARRSTTTLQETTVSSGFSKPFRTNRRGEPELTPYDVSSVGPADER